MTAVAGRGPVRHFANLTHKHTVCGLPRGEVYEASHRRDITCPACADVLDRATSPLAGGKQAGPDLPPAPAAHPAWCDQAHGEMPAHSGQVGDDVELTAELTYGVFLFQQGDDPTEVHLMEHALGETSFGRFSLLQAAILSDLIRQALGCAAREVGLR